MKTWEKCYWLLPVQLAPARKRKVRRPFSSDEMRNRSTPPDLQMTLKHVEVRGPHL